MKKTYLLLLVSVAISITSFAQDIHFSQFSETPQLINPANTGVFDGRIRAIVNYRNQWMAMGHSYNTAAGSVDAPILNKKANKAHLGMGLNFFSDKAGDAKIGLTEVAISFSGIIPVTRLSVLSLGISAGGAQHKADYSALYWGNQYDGTGFNRQINPNEPTTFTSNFYTDLSAGVYYEYFSGKNTMQRNEQKRLGLGFAYYHMNRPEQQYFSATEKLLGKVVVNINGFLDISGTSFSIIPSIVCFVQGKSNEFNVGTLVRYRFRNATKVTGFISESGISIGAHYRFGDAFIPQVNYELSNFAIGISYDVNTSSYATVSRNNGGIEVSLKYLIARGAKWQD